MVAKLAGSLAHVTCKEPIHGSISGQLRNSLQGLGIANELLDQVVQLVINELLTLDIALSSYGLLLGIIAEVPSVILRNFKGLYENASNSALVDAHLVILAAIRDVSKLVVELTSMVLYSEEDRKFNKDITIGLICSELLSLAEYNVHMAKFLDCRRNKAATGFAISLVQTLVVNDSKVITLYL
ncbi:hypothetical protein ACS0TY_007365 [Phlomoides rotata]